MAEKARSELTPKQQRFVAEYLIDLNATQAAIRAGYSAKTAEQQGCRLLRNARVSATIEEGQAKAKEQHAVTAERVIQELARIALVDLGRIYDEDGNLLPIKDMPEDARRAIAGVEVDQLFEGRGDDREMVGVTKKVKLFDKPRALEMLGRHFGLFKDRVEHTGKDGGAIEFKDSSPLTLGRRIAFALSRATRQPDSGA
jgi:phage terminase small subunit